MSDGGINSLVLHLENKSSHIFEVRIYLRSGECRLLPEQKMRLLKFSGDMGHDELWDSSGSLSDCVASTSFQVPSLEPGDCAEYRIAQHQSSSLGCNVTVCLSGRVCRGGGGMGLTGRSYVIKCATPSLFGQPYVKGFEDRHMINEEIQPEKYERELNSIRIPEHREGTAPLEICDSYFSQNTKCVASLSRRKKFSSSNAMCANIVLKGDR